MVTMAVKAMCTYCGRVFMRFETTLCMFIFLITSVNFHFLIYVLFLLSIKVLTAIYCDIDKESNHNLEKESVLVLLCGI
jgi:hypothetical protein